MPAETAGLVTNRKPEDFSPVSTEPVGLGNRSVSVGRAPWLAIVITLVRGTGCKIKGGGGGDETL